MLLHDHMYCVYQRCYRVFKNPRMQRTCLAHRQNVVRSMSWLCVLATSKRLGVIPAVQESHGCFKIYSNRTVNPFQTL